jgi:hypothetical protein
MGDGGEMGDASGIGDGDGITERAGGISVGGRVAAMVASFWSLRIPPEGPLVAPGLGS